VVASLPRGTPEATAFGSAIQQMIEMAKDAGLDLQVLLRVVMDSALAVPAPRLSDDR